MLGFIPMVSWRFSSHLIWELLFVGGGALLFFLMGPKCGHEMKKISVDAPWSYALVNCASTSPHWECYPAKPSTYLLFTPIVLVVFFGVLYIHSWETRGSPAPEQTVTGNYYQRAAGTLGGTSPRTDLPPPPPSMPWLAMKTKRN